MEDLMALLQMLQKQKQSPFQSLAEAAPYVGYAYGANDYQQPAQDLMRAMGNPNSGQYQQIYKQKALQGQQNLAQSIAELSRQNRKLQMMGRTPLLDQERGGESTFRNLMQGYQDVQNQAANDTEGLLAKQYAAATEQGKQKQTNAYNKAGVNSNLLGAMSKLFGL